MKKYIKLMFLLWGTAGFTQNDLAAVEAGLTDFSTKLEARNIDVYFTFLRYCNGTTEIQVMPDGKTCISNGTYAEGYVIWEEDDETRIKKIDNCGMFASVPLQDNKLFNFYRQHVEELLHKNVKPYEIKEREGGPLQRTEIKDCHRKYRFVNEASEEEQSFKPFDLTNDARESNVNYTYNQSLKITTLDALLEAAIARAEAAPVFRRL